MSILISTVAENPFLADIIILPTAGIWIYIIHVKYKPNLFNIYLREMYIVVPVYP